jgi:hypothetical protein
MLGDLQQAGDGSISVPKVKTSVLIVAANFGIDGSGNLTAATLTSDGGKVTSDGNGNVVVNTLTVSSVGGIATKSLSVGGLTTMAVDTVGRIFPLQATTALAPPWVLGALYFDTTLNKLRVGGAAGWETVTSA